MYQPLGRPRGRTVIHCPQISTLQGDGTLIRVSGQSTGIHSLSGECHLPELFFTEKRVPSTVSFKNQHCCAEPSHGCTSAQSHFGNDVTISVNFWFNQVLSWAEHSCKLYGHTAMQFSRNTVACTFHATILRLHRTSTSSLYHLWRITNMP